MLKNRGFLNNTQEKLIPRKGSFTSHPSLSARRYKRIIGIATSLSLLAAALPASAANWWNQTPSISVGPAVVNVINFGANGNGAIDDTAAFQAAINALPSSGGTIVVPDGTYLIDATKGINLRSNTRLSLYGAAYLKAIPNNASFASVVKVWNANNVEILGGHILGERNQHLGSNGEGYGISIQESNSVYVHDITVADSWGDGVLVGTTFGYRTFTPPTGVTLNRVTITNSRRQGLTITAANQVYVVNSSFTGSNGEAPQAGVDIEPQTLGTATQLRLENTVMSNNIGNGVEVHTNVYGLVINNNTADNNQGYGIYALGPTNFTVTNNQLNLNYLFGVDLDWGTNNVQMYSNTITYNGAAWFIARGLSPYTLGWAARDITISSGASAITQYNNTITEVRPPSMGPI
ncbi:right-handed parallel beta-helix repeat-containing protein [Dyella nitratireducens]|uniref:right-handed parallel beta-helix repeat-containing protein n=1 Tax=Dyella nitratireducens TaxID=1849580 RepID=UPI00166B935E|nr:right-handed parallel beta-helix repeat-containing protein [Dyella nitratireducens]